ncbi:type 1 glutamine amidotransferase domain-containing protein [Paraburkholderia terrae]|jgi:putative intracellular protease/amidase|uniref:Type 1 glutamine amidotransferase domain-containing protein n=1 Tax=Paraburkholderia terrae TaxID=311230 RepID=A0A2I8EZS5_9BURK|nr:type 1 glutamine amidotransferase domain-containing protein [Paraburkholderia terrae]AUT64980.1 type 1 glutamine amidotransferase domain-containing protein [Paraburkholderia terrae]
MSKGTILVVGSNATQLEAQGGGTITIGQFLNETAVPLMAVVAAGYDFVLATPTGEKPHMDRDSDALIYFANDDAARTRARDFFNNDPAMNRVRTVRSVIDEGLDRFAGVFFPGGHAPVVDVMQDPDVREVLRHFHTKNKPTAAICHGPISVLAELGNAREFRAALINGDKAKARELATGWQYAGYRMTVFSRSEEEYAEDNVFHAKLLFNMPDALEAAGAEVVTTDQNFTSHVIVDRELVTAQNPMSDHELASKFIAALDRAV